MLVRTKSTINRATQEAKRMSLWKTPLGYRGHRLTNNLSAVVRPIILVAIRQYVYHNIGLNPAYPPQRRARTYIHTVIPGIIRVHVCDLLGTNPPTVYCAAQPVIPKYRPSRMSGDWMRYRVPPFAGLFPSCYHVITHTWYLFQGHMDL